MTPEEQIIFETRDWLAPASEAAAEAAASTDDWYERLIGMDRDNAIEELREYRRRAAFASTVMLMYNRDLTDPMSLPSLAYQNYWRAAGWTPATSADAS